MESFAYSDEYFALIDIILKFDENLLLVKSWSVTFGLATLALGFKEKVRGLFLVAAISGVCFWIVEAEMKWHQTNYYYRMNQIESFCENNIDKEQRFNCPKIDWSWNEARQLSTPRVDWEGSEVKTRDIEIRFKKYLLPHVMIPNIVVIVFGMFFFYRRNFRKWVLNEKS